MDLGDLSGFDLSGAAGDGDDDGTGAGIASGLAAASSDVEESVEMRCETLEQHMGRVHRMIGQLRRDIQHNGVMIHHLQCQVRELRSWNDYFRRLATWLQQVVTSFPWP